MSLTTEILSPTYTAAGLYPALCTLISQVAMPNMIARQFLQPFSLQHGNSVTFPKQSGSAGAVINEVAEGAEILQDVTSYNYVNVTPYKVGQGFVITRETIEDSLLPIQQDQLIRVGLRAANKIDKDCVDTISAGCSGNNTVTATGVSLGMDGTQYTFSGSAGTGYGLGQFDIIDAKKGLETGSFMPDTLFMSPKVKPWIEKNIWFSSYMVVGRNVVDQGIMQVPGMFGSIMGLDAYCSVNCTGSSDDTVGLAYVLSRGRTSTILGQYAPLGFFVERRPITTAVKPIEERDSIGIYVTARYSPVVIRGEAAAKIQTIGQ